MTKPSNRYQLIQVYGPDDQAFIVLGEVYLNDAGDVWAVLPEPVTFMALTEGDVVAEMEKAFAECRAHPVFDTKTLPAPPPSNLADAIDHAITLELFQPTSATKH